MIAPAPIQQFLPFICLGWFCQIIIADLILIDDLFFHNLLISCPLDKMSNIYYLTSFLPVGYDGNIHKVRGEGKMIINTGGRTDTVQYYSDWLLNRFSEGYVLARNPLFCNKVIRYELTPDKVDCVLFCSKNYTPILPRLHEITDRFHTYFYYTITAYGPDLEPGVPGIAESMETLIRSRASDTKISGRKTSGNV
jgi:Domain of unknown function (DUF1848).